MSFITTTRILSPQPDNYIPPDFPSLYWPFPWGTRSSAYLYNAYDIWLFTLYWTLICYAAVHLTAASIAVFMTWRTKNVGTGNWTYNFGTVWIAPVIFGVVGGVEAVVGGSIVGGLLAAIYNAGYFRMSTWIPFVWALVNSLVVILSSFAIQGGL